MEAVRENIQSSIIPLNNEVAKIIEPWTYISTKVDTSSETGHAEISPLKGFPPVLMPPQQSGYIKAPAVDFF